jgi:hypothetical protein
MMAITFQAGLIVAPYRRLTDDGCKKGVNGWTTVDKHNGIVTVSLLLGAQVAACIRWRW